MKHQTMKKTIRKIPAEHEHRPEETQEGIGVSEHELLPLFGVDVEVDKTFSQAISDTSKGCDPSRADRIREGDEVSLVLVGVALRRSPVMDRSNLSLLPEVWPRVRSDLPTGRGRGRASSRRGRRRYTSATGVIVSTRAEPSTFAELTPVQVAIGLHPLGPSQVDVAGRLHQSLSLHHALARLLETALG